MKTYQIIVLAFFILAAIVAVLMFGGVLPGFNNDAGSGKKIKAEVWGTFDKKLMEEFFKKIKKDNENITFSYSEKSEEGFEAELINALANNEGPDIVLIRENLIFKHKKKLHPISQKNYKIRDFKNEFIDIGEMFIYSADQKLLGFPFALDPLIMYYNKDMLKNALIAEVPQNWNDFLEVSKALTIKDEGENIIQAGAALGEFVNISHAKDILSAFIMQSGDPIVDKNSFKVVLGKNSGKENKATASAVKFYSDFSDPRNSAYSWNKFLGNDFEAFLKGKLAVYFGYAGELNKIKELNPNLNFDAAPLPQNSDGIKITFGKIWGASITNKAKNKENMEFAVRFLTSLNSSKSFRDVFYLPPVSRNLLKENQSDYYMSIFYDSAILSRAWLDPDPKETSIAFKKMLESINSGGRKIDQALNDVRGKIERIIKENNSDD